MQARTGNAELYDFVQYATKQLENSSQYSSVEQLVQQWRNGKELADSMEDILQGLDDERAGKSESVEAVFKEIRQRLGISRES